MARPSSSLLTRLPLASSSAPAPSLRRAFARSPAPALRAPDEWSYPSKTGDNRPRRPFLNPDVSEQIPNEVAIRAGLPPYRMPSASLDPFELPPKLPIKHDILTHSITFSAYDAESLRPYAAMARHTALALQIPVTGPLPLPRELTRWSSNKGPFVHAKSKVVFERRVHSQRIDVWDADDKAAEVLIKVLLATGRGEHVKVKVEKFSRDRLDMTPQAPATPLFHKTDRQRAIVADIAARFVAETECDLAREAREAEDRARAAGDDVVRSEDDWKSAPVEGEVVVPRSEEQAKEAGEKPAAAAAGEGKGKPEGEADKQ